MPNPENHRPLIVIVPGQTASGKSALCLDLALRLGGEIVSMDALKVYRGMDIGTAKTPVAERGGVAHYMMDLVDPHESFSVTHYLRAVEPLLADLIGRGVTPIIDCGTPFYLQAFLSGMVEGPEPDLDLRATLETRDSDDLHRELAERDPGAATRLHANDRKRVIRALEYAAMTGLRLSERQVQWQNERTDYRIFMTGPLWPTDALHARISQRVDRMMEAGLLEEVRRIREQGGFSRSAEQAIGYRQLLAHLDGETTLDQAVDLIKLRTRQLARAQLKWFRRHRSVKWLRLTAESELRAAAVFLAGELRG